MAAALNQDTDVEKLTEELSQYGYVRFVVTDIHGISKHKLVPARHALEYSEGGVPFLNGLIALGPRNEVWLPERIREEHYPSGFLQPDWSTLRPLKWSGEGADRTAVVLCETWEPDGEPQLANPRRLARTQLERLEEMGCTLYSSFEYEFKLLDQTTRQPVFDAVDHSSTYLMEPFEPFFKYADQNLLPMGIDIECMHVEHGPGQFETPLRPALGILAADQAFLFKQSLKELAKTRGWMATFMSQFDPIHDGCGGHFNFSLRGKNTKQNLFWNEDSPEDGLSDLAYKWISGITEHFAALTALCSPTVNCYRRLHSSWTPTRGNWDINNREVALRVMNLGDKRTYMENRIASALANPYIVLAATVAAGIDGMANDLEIPTKSKKGARKLPATLSSALDALASDKILIEALGVEFVEWFVSSKRVIEVAKFNADPKNADVVAFSAEFVEYAELC